MTSRQCVLLRILISFPLPSLHVGLASHGLWFKPCSLPKDASACPCTTGLKTSAFSSLFSSIHTCMSHLSKSCPGNNTRVTPAESVCQQELQIRDICIRQFDSRASVHDMRNQARGVGGAWKTFGIGFVVSAWKCICWPHFLSIIRPKFNWASERAVAVQMVWVLWQLSVLCKWMYTKGSLPLRYPHPLGSSPMRLCALSFLWHWYVPSQRVSETYINIGIRPGMTFAYSVFFRTVRLAAHLVCTTVGTNYLSLWT